MENKNVIFHRHSGPLCSRAAGKGIVRPSAAIGTTTPLQQSLCPKLKPPIA
jgi:hypothetical protein